MPVVTRSQAKTLSLPSGQDAHSFAVESHAEPRPSAPTETSIPWRFSSQSAAKKRKAEAPIEAGRCRRSRVSVDAVSVTSPLQSAITNTSKELVERHLTDADNLIDMDEPVDAKIPQLSRLETLPEEITLKILEYVIEPERGRVCTNYWPCENHGHRDAKALAKVSTSIKASLGAVLESWGSHPQFTRAGRGGLECALAIWRQMFKELGIKSKLLDV